MLAFVAVSTTVSSVSSLTLVCAMTGKVGATFTSFTMTEKLLVEVKVGLTAS